jgi:hypothetical protein
VSTSVISSPKTTTQSGCVVNNVLSKLPASTVARETVLSKVTSTPLVGHLLENKEKMNSVSPAFTNITRLCDLQHYVELQQSSDEHDARRGSIVSCVKTSLPSTSLTVHSSSQTMSNMVTPVHNTTEVHPKVQAKQSVVQHSASSSSSAQTNNFPPSGQASPGVGMSGISNRSEGTQAQVKSCISEPSATASHTAIKRTYSNMREHTVEYHPPYKAKANKVRIIEQHSADTNLERKVRQEGMGNQLLMQKSLSEECEDLGVAVPSTSELFPEADLSSLDPGVNFDSSAADASCSQTVDSNDQYPCSDARSVDSDNLQYSATSETSNTYLQKRRKTENMPRYSSSIKKYQNVKSTALQGNTPPCTDINGSKLISCNSHQSPFSSSSGEDSLPLGTSHSSSLSPVSERFEPSQSTTKSPDSQEKPSAPFSLVRRVSQTYGKKNVKSIQKKVGMPEQSYETSRPFASVCKASKQCQDTPVSPTQPTESSSKVAGCSANGTSAADIYLNKHDDTKGSTEDEDCKSGVKRKLSEKACGHPSKRSSRCSSLSADTPNDDDDDDVDTEEPDSVHEDDCESQSYDNKSNLVSSSSSDSNWSVGSPDVSESSVDLRSGGGSCTQRLSRRSSLRGKVKKNCSCCNGSPEPQKIARTNKFLKKGSNGKSISKGHITLKKR